MKQELYKTLVREWKQCVMRSHLPVFTLVADWHWAGPEAAPQVCL